MSKLPAFQFYPGDWMKDPNLRRCSKAAKGVWIDAMCLMFECEDRGVFASGGVPWTREEIAGAIGGDHGENLACLEELLRKGVAGLTKLGAICNRRMVRDEEQRADHRARQHKHRKLQKINKSSDADVTPMSHLSSSSSSSSKQEQKQKPLPKAKPPVDERHVLFRKDFEKAFEHINHVPAPWDAKEATALSRWLKANPTITRDQWQNILRHRKVSPIDNAAPLSMWVSRALSWLNAPANNFGQNASGGPQHGNQQTSSATAKQQRTLDAATSLIGKLRGKDHLGFGEDGFSEGRRGDGALAGAGHGKVIEGEH